jgi:hypothetical protein
MLREFTDKKGTTWQVWDVYPSSSRSPGASGENSVSYLDSRFSSGWLCFSCGEERRRVAPIPTGWHNLNANALEQLCTTGQCLSLGENENPNA